MTLNKKCLVFIGARICFGTLVRINGTTVTLANAREIPHWNGGYTAFDLAGGNINPTYPNLLVMSCRVPEATLFGVTQIIELTDEVANTFEAAPVFGLPDFVPAETA
jgi:hypothetical protein